MSSGAAVTPRSSRAPDEPEAVGLVPRLPAGGLDLLAEPVGLVEVAARACGLAPLGERYELRRSILVDCERLQTEDAERAPQQIVVPPFMHDGESCRGREVVVERRAEPLPRTGRSRLV